MHSARDRMVPSDRFSMVPRASVPRSMFRYGQMFKTTFDAGYLMPFWVDEVLPGDSMKVRMACLARLSTPIVPIMDNMVLDSFFFFVPSRLVWDNWARFMGEEANPGDSTVFLTPQVTVDPGSLGPSLSIFDQFGITTNGGVNNLPVLALPFRAYNLIWNEWFRDQDLQVKVPVNTGDGPDSTADYQILRVGKKHDYFTSARPFAEKPMAIDQIPGVLSPIIYGQAQTVPRGQAGAPVSGLAINADPTVFGPNANERETGTRTSTFVKYMSTSTNAIQMRISDANFPEVRVWINDLRTAIMFQQMMERDARGGTRYTEKIEAHFGVRNPDGRLQRPEYLGGGRTSVSINPVAQTSGTARAADPATTRMLGELAAIGSIQAHDHGFSQSFTEHGFVIGLYAVRGDLTYQQGVERFWFRRTQFDFYWPGLANLGEQAIESREIYCDTTSGDNVVFGFQERWAEYKYKPSRTAGYMRSTAPTPLDMYHLGQKFVGRPGLNAAFVVEDPPVARAAMVNINRGTQFQADFYTECMAARPMPMFSIPGVGPRL